MKIKNITLGCDPELFIKDTENDEIISVIGLLGGTKKEPKKISEEGHAIQEDNVLAEFNIPPSVDKESFIDNINYCKNYLKTILKLYGPLVIDYRASNEMNSNYLNNPKAMEFSCEPDFNVYTESINPDIVNAGNLRSAGGHISIGYDNPNTETNERLVKMMDMILGLESLFLDKDKKRRELYGKAGSFREPEFGVEYRTLSNFWIRDDEMIEWAYDSTIKCINLINEDKDKELIDKYSKNTQIAIDNYDKDLARLLINNIEKDIKEFSNKKEKTYD